MTEKPWENEPDELDWIDPETNFHCFMRRGPYKAWNGYVGIPPTSPLYENEDIDADVHGGITFIGYAYGWKETCDLWMVGFDCAHSFDYLPSLEEFSNKDRLLFQDISISYKDIDYVKKEVESLAKQLKEIEERKRKEMNKYIGKYREDLGCTEVFLDIFVRFIAHPLPTGRLLSLGLETPLTIYIPTIKIGFNPANIDIRNSLEEIFSLKLVLDGYLFLDSQKFRWVSKTFKIQLFDEIKKHFIEEILTLSDWLLKSMINDAVDMYLNKIIEEEKEKEVNQKETIK